MLDRVRQQEVRERRQGMLVCANTEAKRVLGKRKGRGMRGKKGESLWWERIAMEGDKQSGFRFTKTWV